MRSVHTGELSTIRTTEFDGLCIVFEMFMMKLDSMKQKLHLVMNIFKEDSFGYLTLCNDLRLLEKLESRNNWLGKLFGQTRLSGRIVVLDNAMSAVEFKMKLDLVGVKIFPAKISVYFNQNVNVDSIPDSYCLEDDSELVKIR